MSTLHVFFHALLRRNDSGSSEEDEEESSNNNCGISFWIVFNWPEFVGGLVFPKKF